MTVTTNIATIAHLRMRPATVASRRAIRRRMHRLFQVRPPWLADFP